MPDQPSIDELLAKPMLTNEEARTLRDAVRGFLKPAPAAPTLELPAAIRNMPAGPDKDLLTSAYVDGVLKPILEKPTGALTAEDRETIRRAARLCGGAGLL
jgi:hypothetical protein